MTPGQEGQRAGCKGLLNPGLYCGVTSEAEIHRERRNTALPTSRFPKGREAWVASGPEELQRNKE